MNSHSQENTDTIDRLYQILNNWLDSWESNAVVPRWLDISKATRYSSMSKKTLLKLVEKGEIYGTFKGGKWYIDRLSIDKFMLKDIAEIEKHLEMLEEVSL